MRAFYEAIWLVRDAPPCFLWEKLVRTYSYEYVPLEYWDFDMLHEYFDYYFAFIAQRHVEFTFTKWVEYLGFMLLRSDFRLVIYRSADAVLMPFSLDQLPIMRHTVIYLIRLIISIILRIAYISSCYNKEPRSFFKVYMLLNFTISKANNKNWLFYIIQLNKNISAKNYFCASSNEFLEYMLYWVYITEHYMALKMISCFYFSMPLCCFDDIDGLDNLFDIEVTHMYYKIDIDISRNAASWPPQWRNIVCAAPLMTSLVRYRHFTSANSLNNEELCTNAE